MLAYQQLSEAKSDTQNYQKLIMHSAQQHLVQARRDSEYLRDIVLLHRPTRILKQGYTMLEDDNKQILTSSTQLYPKQMVTIMLKDGQATAQITAVNEH